MRVNRPNSELLKFHFIQELHRTESSDIFHVSYKGLEYCLKVFHMDDDPGFSDDGRDLCRYRCESQAYQALQAHGICDQGVVHCFYGVFEDIDPHLLGSSLEAFEDDKKQPCAILLEYLSGSKSFSSHGVFCPELLERAMASLEKIHAAGVIHNDSYPKNILVVSGGKGCPRQRVVWIDFDVSIVFSADIAGQILDLDLDGEAEWEMRVFKSRVRKMEQEQHSSTLP